MKTIELTQNKVALVDDCYFDALFAMEPWHYDGRYATARVGGKRVRMHNAVLKLAGKTRGPSTDHRNRNPLDNQLLNLRTATSQENNRNRGPNRNNRSGFKGVSYAAKCNLWRATLNIDGKQIHLGLYSRREDAAKAYDRAAVEHFGEFAFLNFAADYTLAA